MRKPKFSIIIPTYNTTGMLEQCLKSIGNQRVHNNSIEIIVVNDGGREGGSEDRIISDKKLTIKYYYQEHKGPAVARNLGIDKAMGEIIIFLDDDSEPTKDWLESVYTTWKKYSDFDGIGGYVTADRTDSIYCRVNADFFNWYMDRSSSDKDRLFLCTCNAGYKKSVLKEAGQFDGRFLKAAGEDRDLNMKIVKNGGRLRLDKNILVYHDRDLTFESFVRKHYNYGIAAYNIYRRYSDLKKFSLFDYIDYYSSILKKYSKFTEKIIAFSLLTLLQLFTIAGYYSAALTKRE